MNLEKYTELTGITVPSSQTAKYTAAINRTKSKLETILGFSLTPKNLYTERGKVQFEGHTPILEDVTNLDNITLLEPDEEIGLYKLFPYNERDAYLHVDPFKNVYKVKLVFPITDGEFITVTQLENVVPEYQRDNIGKFIQKYFEWFTWDWYRNWYYPWRNNGDPALMLAVDADWIDCYPDDLMYLWADMITYYTSPNYSISGSIKSESVDGHSWSIGNPNGNNAVDQSPEASAASQRLLKRYAGPFGADVGVNVG